MDPITDGFNSSSIQVNLLENQQSQTIQRNRKVITIFFSFVILLALFIGALILTLLHKSTLKIDSDSRNFKRVELIRAFCSVTHYPYKCLTSLSSQSMIEIINPDHIIKFSLQIATRELTNLNSSLVNALASKSNESITESRLWHCASLVHDSMNNMEKLSSENIEETMLSLIMAAQADLESCFNILGSFDDVSSLRLSSKVHKAMIYMRNSFDILVNRNVILGKLKSKLGKSSCVDYEKLFTLCMYFPQYFVLIFLLCLLLRIY